MRLCHSSLLIIYGAQTNHNAYPVISVLAFPSVLYCRVKIDIIKEFHNDKSSDLPLVVIKHGVEVITPKWGCISTFFLFFCQFQNVGVYQKADQLIHFLCDISIYEYKVCTKKVFKFHTFCRQLYFFLLYFTYIFLMTFFCSTPHFFCP